MAQKLIRDIPDGVLKKIDQKARAAGVNSEEWIRQYLLRISEEPMVRERYAYRFYGEDGARGTLKRHGDALNDVADTYSGLNSEQANVVKKAMDFVRRNEPGDQLKAYDLLKSAFNEVFEVPV